MPENQKVIHSLKGGHSTAFEFDSLKPSTPSGVDLLSEPCTFFHKKKEYQSLSNFWPCDIVLKTATGDVEYASGEHCFHGQKYAVLAERCSDPVRKQQLAAYAEIFSKNLGSNQKNLGSNQKNGSSNQKNLSSIQTALEAKQKGGKKGFKLLQDELEIWNEASIDVQRQICTYKLEHYAEVQNDLKKSGNRILLHPAMRCSDEKVHGKIWEGRAKWVDGKIEVIGQNRLGKIWMELRDRL